MNLPIMQTSPALRTPKLVRSSAKDTCKMINSDFTPRPYAAQLEIWRPLPDYEGFYEVSNLGHIRRIASGRSTRPGRILKGYVIRDGYLRVCLSKNGKSNDLLIHRLVAIAFIHKPPTEFHEVNHINSDRTDNRVDNLEWVTHQENIVHSFKSGYNTHAGEKNSHATLNWQQVREIRAWYVLGRTQPELAEIYGVTRGCISKIITRRSWKEKEQ